MSTQACLVIFAPTLIGCGIAVLTDIAARAHGGAATPTPVPDLIALAAGHIVHVILIAIPAALAGRAMRGNRRGRA